MSTSDDPLVAALDAAEPILALLHYRGLIDSQENRDDVANALHDVRVLLNGYADTYGAVIARHDAHVRAAIAAELTSDAMLDTAAVHACNFSGDWCQTHGVSRKPGDPWCYRSHDESRTILAAAAARIGGRR